MARKSAIDQLSTAIAGILSEYAEDIQGNVAQITEQMGKKGAQALRRQSRQALKKGTGEYAKGWKYEFRKTRRYAKTTIFNEHYSLPHLLEYGHVTRNGTQRVYPDTPAHEHIKPVEDELIKTFEREVVAKL